MPGKTEAALAWAARGFRVFPLRENGTKPIWEGWTETATIDAATIRAWWEGTDYNIGVCTTGLLVVDVDTKEGRSGLASLQVLGAPETLTIRTKSGGFHLYYWGADVALSQGALGPGLDVRSHHGYVVAPGSIVDGAGYEVVRDVPMERAPEHIVSRCKAPRERVENSTVALVDLDTDAALRLAVQRIESTPGAVQGEQSEKAYKLACAVRDFGISEHLCGVLMDVWAARCSPPIMPDDLRGRIANAYAYAQGAAGAKHPEAMFGQVVIPEVPALPVAPALAAATSVAFGNALALGTIKPRPHVFPKLLMLRETTALLAAGGIGKSLFSLTVAAHVAMGVDFLSYKNAIGRPAKAIIYDAEDDMDEMSMRLHAICSTLSFDFEQVRANIALISGRNHGRFRLCERNGHNPAIIKDAVGAITAAASDPEVVLLGLNPLNKLHTLNGNDNVEMTFVMEVIEAMAEAANVAVLLSHHTSKGQLGMKRAGNAEMSMGAMAVINGSRNALTLAAPEDEDCARFGLSGAERRMFLRLDDAKANRHLSAEEATWIRKVPVRLWNGEEVGAFDKADMHVRTEHLRKLIARVLMTEMKHSRHTGGVTVKEAVSILRSVEPMFKTLSAETVRQRVMSYLADPVELETGDKIVCVEEPKGWKVVLT